MTNKLSYRGNRPSIADDAFIADNARIIGDVHVGAESSVWFGTVVRGDVMPIRIGARSSIQDNSVIHTTGGWTETHVGDDVTVGHAVVLHGCSLSDRVLVGMGSVIMDAVEIGSDTIIAAGSLITPNTKIPGGVLALGRPARVVRPLHSGEFTQIRESAQVYVGLTHDYRSG